MQEKVWFTYQAVVLLVPEWTHFLLVKSPVSYLYSKHLLYQAALPTSRKRERLASKGKSNSGCLIKFYMTQPPPTHPPPLLEQPSLPDPQYWFLLKPRWVCWGARRNLPSCSSVCSLLSFHLFTASKLRPDWKTGSGGWGPAMSGGDSLSNSGSSTASLMMPSGWSVNSIMIERLSFLKRRQVHLLDNQGQNDPKSL